MNRKLRVRFFGAGVRSTTSERLRWLGWRSPAAFEDGLELLDGAAFYSCAADRSAGGKRKMPRIAAITAGAGPGAIGSDPAEDRFEVLAAGSHQLAHR